MRNSPPSRSPSTDSYTERAHRYAEQVVAGKIVACRWVRLACQRHLNDLARQRDTSYPYRFDESRAIRACRFIEALPHTKGRWADAGERLVLQPWQLFIVCCLFGWVVKRTGTYRFRIAYIEVPRKNAKSTLAAAIGLYKLAADREFGAEVYSGATTEKQAWEVFLPAKQMAERTAAFRRAFNIVVHAKSLAIEHNGSRFEPVIGRPGDGASPSCAIVDEYHEHQTDEMFNTMLTGMGARENPLLLVITTAGTNQASPCYALDLDIQKILDGKVTNDKVFGIIYTIDDDDDWTSPDALLKANPNFDVSVKAEFLREQQIDAIASARKQNAFKTKHLNIWANADVPWMNMVDWNRVADPRLTLEQFVSEPCMIGLDLASRVDMASKLYLFRRPVFDEPLTLPAEPEVLPPGTEPPLRKQKYHYYSFGVHYLNEAAIENPRNPHYFAWSNEGRLVQTPGNVTDYNWIAEGLIEDCQKFIIREVPHDPYHAAALIQFIQARPDWNQSATFVEVRQTVQQMSPAMKELEALVLEGRFHHNGDPVLGWMISNVICHHDSKDNIFPRKQREEFKIDGVIALLVALNRWMAQPADLSDFDFKVDVW